MSLRNALFGLYVVICAAAVTWPGYRLFGNRVEPFVLGSRPAPPAIGVRSRPPSSFF